MRTIAVVALMAWVVSGACGTAGAEEGSRRALARAAASDSGGTDAATRAQVLKPDQDAGLTESGKPLQFDFPVRNVGKAPLQIFGAKADCGCMVPKYPDVIPPGATRSVQVTMNTKGFVGPTEKHVYLECDDPEQASLLLTVKATFPEAVRVLPSPQLMLPITRGKAIETRVTLRAADRQPVQVLTAGVDRPFVKVTPVAAGPGQDPTLAIRVGANAPETGFEAIVRVQTSHPNCPWLVIKLFGQPEGGVTTQPARVDFGHLHPDGATPVVRLLALSRRQGAFKVLGVETKDPGLRVTVDKDATPRYCELEVAYVGGWTQRQVGGTIVIRTDDPRRPRIEVPYTAEVW